MSTKDIHENQEPATPLGLGSSEGLGPAVPERDTSPQATELRTLLEARHPEPAAHMYPSDLEKFQSAETFATAYSVAVGNPDERSVPLYTYSDMVHAIDVAVKSERYACSIAVWMTLQDALAEDADDKGLDGWMREAEQRVKRRA